MRAPLSMVLFFGTVVLALVTSLTLSTQVSGQYVTYGYQICATALSPNKCSALGNSICNQAGVGTCSNAQCKFCSSTNAIPQNFCLAWESDSCRVPTGSNPDDCGSTSNWLEGDCAISGSCICDNPSYIRACGTNTLTYSCVP